MALDLNIYTVYFPPNCTHLVQPVDHRVAAWLKAAFHTFYKFEEEEKYEIWADYRANGSLSLPQLRETLLRWVAAAWAELKKMPTFLQKAFVSTGCLITLKGEHHIKFLDISNYSFEYPEDPEA